MKAALYVRVSTAEQKHHGISITEQISSLTKYCDNNNIVIYDIYNDAGISGHISYQKRPSLCKMLSDCEKKKFDIILFTRLDRFYRNSHDYYYAQEILDRNGIIWKSLREPEYDPSTANGRLIIGIMNSINEHEANVTSERIRAIYKYKKSKGEFIGPKPPLGYKIENKRLVINEKESEETRLLFDTYLDTWSSRKTQIILREHGYSLSDSTIRQIVKKELYCGIYNGYDIPSYITYEQHVSIVEHYADAPRWTKKRNYVFTGILFYKENGKRLSSRTSNISKKYFVKSYMIRREDKPSLNISETKLEKFMIEYCRKYFDDVELREPNETHNAKYDIEGLKRKLERIGIRFEDGDISLEEYKNKRSEILNTIKLAEEKEQDFKFEMPDNWIEAYKTLDAEKKRSFWRSFVSKIIIDDDKNIEVVFM